MGHRTQLMCANFNVIICYRFDIDDCEVDSDGDDDEVNGNDDDDGDVNEEDSEEGKLPTYKSNFFI